MVIGKCKYCNRSSVTISDTLGYCAECIRTHFHEVWPDIEKVHEASRKRFGLPLYAPMDPQGLKCGGCVRDCHIGEGGLGYCGIRRHENGRLKGGRPHEGNLYFYYDALPTNCVADWVCPAGTGTGYPTYASCKGPEYGYYNLAVFYHACAFNCLYCQNWSFKERTYSKKRLHAKDLASAVDERTTCICYFGGDPTPQILHALTASRLAIKATKGRILRICWETNGSMNKKFLKSMADLSLESGGCIKFDLKAWSEEIHMAMCGVTNKRTLENFEKLAGRIHERPIPPFLIASTLLVPGYVDEKEVEGITRFISSLSSNIPYVLLGFYPHFYMNDLPTTSEKHAMRCKEIALKMGLRDVRIGNIHLLGHAY
jgi:pyruvate formate lyase activating enzyme